MSNATRHRNPWKKVFEDDGLIDAQLEALIGAGNIKRYHTVATIKENTVAHHSYGVAVLCMLLDPCAGMALQRAALLHDVAEQWVGDIPAPVKRQLDIRQQLHEAENTALKNVSLGYEEMLSDAERIILNIADSLDGMLYCINERRMGNREVQTVFTRYAEYVRLSLDRLLLQSGRKRTHNRVTQFFLVMHSLWEEANR